MKIEIKFENFWGPTQASWIPLVFVFWLNFWGFLGIFWNIYQHIWIWVNRNFLKRLKF